MLEEDAHEKRGAAGEALVSNRLLPLRTNKIVLERGGRRLVDRLDLTIDAPGITVLMGPNGAGKSLTLRIIHGLIPPTDGSVTWAGQALTPDIRRLQAMVFQRPQLLRRSVGANIDFALRLRGTCEADRRQALLHRVGLADRTTQPARSLSGGEQQRLALARALALEPAVLLLDEPTASLDAASALMIEQILLDEARCGLKLILVSHDIGQARRLASDVVFLRRGRLEEHAPADDFFAQPRSQAGRDYLDGRIVL